MTARYLVRFDDVCPTMNWRMWDRIEEVLTRERVLPILAIVPNNVDPKLVVGEPLPMFWNRVREWQARGWTIGLHGWEHRYVTVDAGILSINRRSEFAGLPANEQQRKIGLGLESFAAHGVRADVFVAPGHSFDLSTVEALKLHGLRIISDGLYFRCVEWRGMTFVPQQLWHFKKMPFGTWTICHHHNSFSESDFATFRDSIRRFRAHITSLPEVVRACRPFGLLDAISPRVWHIADAAKELRRRLTRLRTGRSYH